MAELKETIDAIGRAFETFKTENDQKIKALEAKGTVDPILTEKVEKINADITRLNDVKAQVEALETRVGRMAIGTGGGGTTEVDQTKAEHKAAFENWFRKGGENNLAAVRDLQVRAGLSTLSDPDGAYLIAPPEFDKAIDRVAGTVSVMRNLATVRSIGTNTYKKIVNMGGAGSGWVAEKESRSETSTPTLKEIAINMKEVYAEPGCTQISLDDSVIDLASWLADEVSVEFAEQEGEAFVTGDGSSRPHGIAGYTMITNANYAFGKVGYVPGGHATVLDSTDKLIDLQHALKATYRNGASWLLNDLTCAAIRKLKDGNGDYIWQPGLAASVPDLILGKPVAYDDNVASIGAGAFPIFFANFKRAYLILDRMGIRILRNPYSSPGNIMFYCTKRIGGGIISFEAIKALKISVS